MTDTPTPEVVYKVRIRMLARKPLFCLLIVFSSVLHTFAAVSVTVSPRQAPLTLHQPQQFTAKVAGSTNMAVTWLVDGTAGGNSTLGTVSSSGLYTPPATVGHHTVSARSKADTTKSASASVWVTNYPGMMTYHADKYRSGLNSQEIALSASTVNPAGFGKLYSFAVDGQVYAQPLYVANLKIGGVTRNVLYIATEHDGVYAFDADHRVTAPLWYLSFLASGVTTRPQPANGVISPEMGITGTPVIDMSTQTIYVVATTVDKGTLTHRLHALSLTTGAEKFGGPIVISGSYAGLTFSAVRHLQRPALLEIGGNVYIAFGSLGDALPYQGWLFAYSASGGKLHQVAAFSTAPQANGAASIWMSGGGPAADDSGNIYVASANGEFTLNTGGNDAGDSLLRLTLSGSKLAIADYYTPGDQATLTANDWDFGTGGVYLPPTQTGAAAPNLVLEGGKDGVMYLINRANFGHYNPTQDGAVQRLSLGDPDPANGNFFTPAGWNGLVFFGPTNAALQSYQFANGTLPAAPTSSSQTVYHYPGPTPMVSANGNASAIVWALDNSAYIGGTPSGAAHPSGPAVLHAYNAANLALELYNSSQSGTRDTCGTAIKFSVPTVANGHVYVGGAKTVTVFGLLP